MEDNSKFTRSSLLTIAMPHMHAFDTSWIAYFLALFGWFGIARLILVVRDRVHFFKQQIGSCVVGSVATTMVARFVMGRLCDCFGPPLTDNSLLDLGSLPVMEIALAHRFFSDGREGSFQARARHRLDDTAIDPTGAVA